MTMLVAGVRMLGGTVETFEVDEPRPLAADEVLIDVRSTGVGNWDDIIRTGGWDVGTSPPLALGVEAAGATPLARALVACAAGRTPSGALAAGGPTTLLRVRRLGGRPNSRALAATAYLAATAVLVVPTLALALPWLTELHRLFIA